MPRIKISKKTVDSIQPPIPKTQGKAAQEFYRDTELTGFGLKVTDKGTKTYIVESRINGKPKRITLGRHGALTPEQARKQARITLGDIALGSDPIAATNRMAQHVIQNNLNSSGIKKRHMDHLIYSVCRNLFGVLCTDNDKDFLDIAQIGKTSPHDGTIEVIRLEDLINSVMDH